MDTPRNELARFGMDTITLAGDLDQKLAAIADAGFTQVMLSARDVAGYRHGVGAAAKAITASGLRLTGFQVLRDFEGLTGHLHDYKLDIAKRMIETSAQLSARVMLVCSSTSGHATHEPARLADDLAKLATLATPFNVKIAYEALSWGRHVNELNQANEIVMRAHHPNLGLGVDSFHMFATKTSLNVIDELDPDKIFLVQLSDFMWQETRTAEERIATARTFRVFPGEGVHGAALVNLVRKLDAIGYSRDYSFEVFNDDYQQLPLDFVAARARRSAAWLDRDVLRTTPKLFA